MATFLTIVVIYLLINMTPKVTSVPTMPDPIELDPEFWLNQAHKEIRLMTAGESKQQLKARADSAILFIGDGMGMTTVTGMRYLKGQLAGKLAGAVLLDWELWPYSTTIRTMNLDSMTTDSAASATAYHTGCKARTDTIGVTGQVELSNCSTYSPKYDLKSIADFALEAGKSVGLVTTTTVTHASPAPLYAHSADRHWENDKKVAASTPDPKMAANCPDIARQLIDNAINYNVVFGGGSANFYQTPNSDTPPSPGNRSDGRNLIKEWKIKQTNLGRRFKVALTTDEFREINPRQHDYALALLNPGDLPFDKDRAIDEPDLAELVYKAISILQKNPKGYYLFVEGARIDHAHHRNKARYALTDGLAFEKAVTQAQSMVNDKRTMMLVTADHSHTFTISGAPSRNLDIFGLEPNQIGLDRLPYTGVSYANGPSAKIDGKRDDLTEVDTTALSFMQQSLVPLKVETHSGEDVPIYVTGPHAYLYKRFKDNTFIPYSMMYAMCIGPFTGLSHCDSSVNRAQLWLLISCLLIRWFYLRICN